MIRLVLALLLLLPVGHVASEGSAPAAIEVEGGSLIVPVLLNGRGPFPMILDNGVTGAAVIDRRVAVPLGLPLLVGCRSVFNQPMRLMSLDCPVLAE